MPKKTVKGELKYGHGRADATMDYHIYVYTGKEGSKVEKNLVGKVVMTHLYHHVYFGNQVFYKYVTPSRPPQVGCQWLRYDVCRQKRLS